MLVPIMSEGFAACNPQRRNAEQTTYRNERGLFLKSGVPLFSGERNPPCQRKHGDLRTGSQPDGGSPVSGPFTDVHPGTIAFVEPLDVGLTNRRDQVPGKKLPSMRMPCEDKIESQ